MLENLLQALIFVLPAYVANGAPVIGVKLIGRATPIDRGAKAWDGRRVLGDGKTIEGLIVGISSGAAAGLLILLCLPQFYRGVLEPLTLSVGAILGDIFGSFVKRRLGLKRGQPAPGLDQLGFVCFALALSIIVYGIPAWLDMATLTSLLLITAFLHVGTNYLAYLLGLKREPY